MGASRLKWTPDGRPCMSYTVAHEADGKNVLPDSMRGEMWLLRETLDTENLGFTVLALEPNEETKRHEHVENEQEEIYYVVEGGVDVDFGDHRESLAAHEMIRISPDEERQIRNRDGFSKLLLVSAPA